jgi:DNA (cytosine-5)-methyltransferase 1
VDNTEELRIVSLFSGYGGLDIGLGSALERLGMRSRVSVSCEIEAYAVACSISKMESGQVAPHPIWSDVKTFPCGSFRGVDVVTGGFPCQPFSAAGSRKADDDPRHLFPSVLRVVRECRPEWVFLENVAGLLSAKLGGDGWNDPKGTPVLLHALRELERVGYRAEAGIFSAVEVGAPHQRKRVFILAHNCDDRRYERRKSVTEAGSYGTDGDNVKSRELGDTEHDGLTRGTISGGAIQAGNHYEERAVEACEPARASRPEELRDIPLREWPVGQGPKQHGWEEPRTTVKPELGGAVDGAPGGVDPIVNRVDRLRMLGNGVVPQVAEKAFLELYGRFV